MVSWARAKVVGGTAALAFAAGAAFAQYPGQVSTTPKDQPILRAISVLEWTGDAGKPKTSRIIPVTVFDGQTLQDGGIYLARPAPLAVSSEVEYELRKDGRNVGLYDVKSAGQQQGAWVGFGVWKSMPKPKPAAAVAKLDATDYSADDDRPILHRKHQGDDSKNGTSSPAPAPDPDRPTLHKKTSDEGPPGTGDASAQSSTSSSTDSDDDRPTLHKKDTAGPAGSGSTDDDTDRPTLHRGKPATASAGDAVDALPAITDPDRPRLLRGKPPESETEDELPSLVGMPQEMHQMVAVSDSRNRPEHVWSFSWSNPADEQKLQGELEDIARQALGLTAPVTPAAKATHARTAHTGAAKKASVTVPPELADEDFRVFELAYGSGATMVLSARSDAQPGEQKFVTLIAQPDLYGNVRVLFKSVTDSRHLEDTPRMRLVDAVDALSDNRAELLFELRGRSQRQFALYRVYRGQVDRLFVTSGEWFGTAAAE
jgi:hypothetical protein